MIILNENKTILNDLFAKYKELASKVGLVNSDGKLFYNENSKSDELKTIIQEDEAGIQARALLRETYENEKEIYTQMEAIRNEIDRIRKKEA